MSTRQARRRQQRANPSRNQPQRTARSRSSSAPWWTSWYAFGGVLVVIAVVVVGIVYTSNNSNSSFTSTPASHSLMNALTGLKAQQVASKVGAGGLVAGNVLTKIHDTTMPTLNGKPVLFYYGAEFCPYCAATRWGLIAAVARFGTLKNVWTMESETNDVYKNTRTFTLAKAHYHSKYLSFVPREVEDRSGNSLQTPPPWGNTVVNKYDISNGQASFPFLYLAGIAKGGLPFSTANQSQIFFSGLNLTTLTGGSPLSWDTIAADLKNPHTVQAKGIFGHANWLTAGICIATHNKPASVCTLPYISTLETQLKAKGIK